MRIYKSSNSSVSSISPPLTCQYAFSRQSEKLALEPPIAKTPPRPKRPATKAPKYVTFQDRLVSGYISSFKTAKRLKERRKAIQTLSATRRNPFEEADLIQDSAVDPQNQGKNKEAGPSANKPLELRRFHDAERDNLRDRVDTVKAREKEERRQRLLNLAKRRLFIVINRCLIIGVQKVRRRPLRLTN